MTSSSHPWREIVLPDGLDAARIARHWLAAQIGHLTDEVSETAALLVSELVTNALRYGRPAVVARMRLTGSLLEVAVRDHGEAAPVPPPSSTHPDTHEPSGRGLYIVDKLATDWGIQPLGPGLGKVVWFQLRTGGATASP